MKSTSNVVVILLLACTCTCLRALCFLPLYRAWKNVVKLNAPKLSQSCRQRQRQRQRLCARVFIYIHMYIIFLFVCCVIIFINASNVCGVCLYLLFYLGKLLTNLHWHNSSCNSLCKHLPAVKRLNSGNVSDQRLRT